MNGDKITKNKFPHRAKDLTFLRWDGVGARGWGKIPVHRIYRLTDRHTHWVTGKVEVFWQGGNIPDFHQAGFCRAKDYENLP